VCVCVCVLSEASSQFDQQVANRLITRHCKVVFERATQDR